MNKFKVEKINWPLLVDAVNANLASERRGKPLYTKPYLYNVLGGWRDNKKVKKLMERLLSDGK